MKIKAAVVKKIGAPFTMEDNISLHSVGPNDLQVHMVASGICHSDDSIRMGRQPLSYPIILGHEGSGIVEKVGSNVTNFKPGDHIIMSYWADHECDKCLSGKPTQCRNFNKGNFSGVRPDGEPLFVKDGKTIADMFNQSSFTTTTVIDKRNAIKVDKNLDLRKLGPLGCGYVTGSGTVFNNLKPEPGSSFAVFGTGAVGLAAMMAARIMGCTKVIAVDIVPSRLELAKKLGATDVINSKDEDPVAKIKELTNGYGVNYTVDTTGIINVTRNALDALQQGGTCVGIAVTPNDVKVSEWKDLSANDKSFVGVLMGDAVPQIDIPRLIDFYKLGEFNFDQTEKFYDFDQINEANEDSLSGKTIKPVLIIDKDYQPGD